MKEYRIINSDQGHRYTHTVRALSKEEAIKNFNAGHYGTVVSCEKVGGKIDKLRDENQRLKKEIEEFKKLIKA